MTENKIGFTGTQSGMTDVQWEKLHDVLGLLSANAYHDLYSDTPPPPKMEFHHGDCIGADAEASISAKELGYIIVSHPPIERSKRAFTKPDLEHKAKPYLKRNRDIVDSTELLVACPKGPEELRSGTWATIRYAKKNKKPVIIIYPDAQITRIN